LSKRRSKAEIFCAILKAIQEETNESGNAKLTHVQGKANIPYDRFKKYVDSLKQGGLVQRVTDPERQEVVITEKGKLYLERYESVADFLKTFGLE
jgi:predicted transcriptional regulator